jgi:hypothetical protein
MIGFDMKQHFMIALIAVIAVAIAKKVPVVQDYL